MEHSTGWSDIGLLARVRGRVIGVPELGRETNSQSLEFSRIQITNGPSQQIV